MAFAAACHQQGNLSQAILIYSQIVSQIPEYTEAKNNLQKSRTLLSRQQMQQYTRNLESLHSSVYMDYPGEIHLETQTLCNASCSFCPYRTLARKNHTMPDNLVTKIINDLTDIPPHIPFQISPFKVNEPFLEPRLFSILAQISTKLKNASISLTTNASVITEKTLDRLERLASLKSLRISFNEITPERYSQAMKLPFENTLSRIRIIHEYKEKGRLPFPIFLSRVGDDSSDDIAFHRWVRENFPAFQVIIFKRGSWLQQIQSENISPIPDIGCARWFELSITSTGEIAHCCMDGAGNWPIGNANKNHVLDIYNSPAFKKLRTETTSRLIVQPCNQCTFL